MLTSVNNVMTKFSILFMPPPYSRENILPTNLQRTPTSMPLIETLHNTLFTTANPDKRDKCLSEIIFCQKNTTNNF